jgi:phosphoglycolate phosphatase-like HAD superfamily hydrolase
VHSTESRSSTVDADVSVLRWPTEEQLRQQLAWFGLPRMLLLDPGVQPPEALDGLEDWMRVPADALDLRARSLALQRRAAEPARHTPFIDDDDLLWVGSAWVSITGAQAPVLRLLLDHLDRVVRFDAVVATYESAGGSGHPASVRTLLSRLGARVRPVGLDLVTVRRRGVLLTMAAPPTISLPD